MFWFKDITDSSSKRFWLPRRMPVHSVTPSGAPELMTSAGQWWRLRPADSCYHLILSSLKQTLSLHTHRLTLILPVFCHHNYPIIIYSLGHTEAELHYYLKLIVLSALSATALAFSISVAWRWKAMYCSQRMELLGLPSTRRSKSSADWGCRLGSMRAASTLQSSFSFFCFSSSFSFFVFFFSWKSKTGGLRKGRHFMGE